MKKVFVRIVAVCLMAMCALALFSCDELTSLIDSTPPADEGKKEEKVNFTYDDINVSDYVVSVQYKGLEITVDEGKTKEDALWDAIYSTVQMSSYPEDKVEYYFSQTKKAYMHMVDGDEDDYLLLLKNRGMTEQNMRDDAEKMVRQDLIYLYITKTEGIELTEQEKAELFDKYVDKYVIEFNKTHEYIAENMADYVYDSMLYDKTMEFLIENNEFADSDSGNRPEQSQ